jgi:hypothetical protein
MEKALEKKKTDRIEIAERLEFPLAHGAVMMELRLTVMLVQSERILKKSLATFAVVVLVVVVQEELDPRVQVQIAPLAVVMLRALDVVLLEPHVGVEVPSTRTAYVMALRVDFVLFESTLMREISVAAVAVCHRSVSGFCEVKKQVLLQGFAGGQDLERKILLPGSCAAQVLAYIAGNT